MTFAQSNPGYFIFSLDTELRWGYFDLDRQRQRIFSEDGLRERRAITGLLDLCDEYDITATWALVGHLFLERCEECQICPLSHWHGRYASFGEIYGTADPRWYAPDTIKALVTRRDRHEIAFHGFTHEIFDRLDRTAVLRELQEWRRFASRYEIKPLSLIFPRNQVRFLDLFEEEGFICYRSNERLPSAWTPDTLGRLRKYFDLLSGRHRPPLYSLTDLKSDGLINLRASEHLFAFNRRLECILDRLGLYQWRLRGLAAAIPQAAQEGKVLHLWAHPWQLRKSRDFAKVRYLFELVAKEVRQGRMRSVGMAEMAKIVSSSSF